jgi:hypothetical protein
MWDQTTDELKRVPIKMVKANQPMRLRLPLPRYVFPVRIESARTFVQGFKMSTFEIVCVKCGHGIKGAGEVTAGEKFRCPRCPGIIQVPDVRATEAPMVRAEVPNPGGHTVREVPPYSPKDPKRASPKSDRKVENVVIDGHVYTLQTGSAAQVQRMMANKTFSGFRGKAEVKSRLGKLGITRNPDGSYNFGNASQEIQPLDQPGSSPDSKE